MQLPSQSVSQEMRSSIPIFQNEPLVWMDRGQAREFKSLLADRRFYTRSTGLSPLVCHV
jgi:hypothetical protein